MEVTIKYANEIHTWSTKRLMFSGAFPCLSFVQDLFLLIANIRWPNITGWGIKTNLKETKRHAYGLMYRTE
jgi:hypothetical protein